MSEFNPLAVVDAIAMTQIAISTRGRCRAVSTMLSRMGIETPEAVRHHLEDAIDAERYSRLAIARAALADPEADAESALHLVRLAAFGTGPSLQHVANGLTAAE